MQTEKFSKEYKKLNPRQREAVDNIEGPVMVIAGPGTGKTQILTLRIANILLKTQINPENILALTFSESATFQMRERLLEIIGSSSFRVEISTFHSFANSIITNFSEEFETLISSESILEDEQIQYLEKLIETLDLKFLKPWGEPLFYAKDILSAINQLKKESVNPSKLADALLKQRQDFENIPDLIHAQGKYKGVMKGKYQDMQKDMKKLEEFIEIYSAYSNLLLKEKKYDFSDMLIEVVKVLEKNTSLLLLIQEKYQYILVDEHQDTNASQNRLIELISSFYEIPNLFVVGDEKQSIYRFQGASIENFLYFQKKYPQAKLINLNQNYRSHQIILDASVSFISKNISANILSKDFTLVSAQDKKPEKIKLAVLDDYSGEFEFIAESANALIKKGSYPKEIAVFARRNFELLELADFFKRKSIPIFIDADLDILSDIWIKKFLIILDCVSDFSNEEKFGRVLNIDVLKIDPFEVYKLFQSARKENLSIFEVLEKGKDFQSIKKFYSLFKGWLSLSANIPFDELFIKILNESNIREGFLSSPDRNEIRIKFVDLFESVKEKIYKNPEYSLKNFLEKLSLIKKHNLQIKAKSEISRETGVRLLTVHKAKGQEFDFVFIMQCISGRWGNLRKRGEKIKLPWRYLGEKIKAEVDFEAIEDERRLFFVGMTRAKKDVILTYSKFSSDGKEQLPSQFLEELNPELIEVLDTQNFNAKFIIQKDILFDEVKPSLDHKREREYFKKLFLEKGLNVSSFDNFLKCPWKYFFINLISIPASRDKYQLFGSAMHASLDNLIKNRKQKNPKEYLIKKLEWNLNQQGLSKKDFKEYFEKGKISLEGFCDRVFINFSPSIQSEINIKGIKISENLTLNGRIDMLEEIKKGEFIVHDFKTGKPKSRREIDGSKGNSKYNYLRQLIFYKLLLDRYREGLFKTKTGIVDFVEPDEKGRFKSEIFEINESDTVVLLKELQSVADQISNLTFWNSFCGEKDCEWCALRKMMNSS